MVRRVKQLKSIYCQKNLHCRHAPFRVGTKQSERLFLFRSSNFKYNTLKAWQYAQNHENIFFVMLNVTVEKQCMFSNRSS